MIRWRSWKGGKEEGNHIRLRLFHQRPNFLLTTNLSGYAWSQVGKVEGVAYETLVLRIHSAPVPE